MSVFRQLLHPSKLLRRRAMYKGLLGGSRGWLSIGLVMWTWDFLKRFFAGGDPLTRYMEELQPGERLVIAHPEPALSRRKARKARKSAAKSDAAAKAAAKSATKAEAAAKALMATSTTTRRPRRMRVKRG